MKFDPNDCNFCPAMMTKSSVLVLMVTTYTHCGTSEFLLCPCAV